MTASAFVPRPGLWAQGRSRMERGRSAAHARGGEVAGISERASGEARMAGHRQVWRPVGRRRSRRPPRSPRRVRGQPRWCEARPPRGRPALRLGHGPPVAGLLGPPVGAVRAPVGAVRGPAGRRLPRARAPSAGAGSRWGEVMSAERMEAVVPAGPAAGVEGLVAMAPASPAEAAERGKDVPVALARGAGALGPRRPQARAALVGVRPARAALVGARPARPRNPPSRHPAPILPGGMVALPPGAGAQEGPGAGVAWEPAPANPALEPAEEREGDSEEAKKTPLAAQPRVEGWMWTVDPLLPSFHLCIGRSRRGP